MSFFSYSSILFRVLRITLKKYSTSFCLIGCHKNIFSISTSILLAYIASLSVKHCPSFAPISQRFFGRVIERHTKVIRFYSNNKNWIDTISSENFSVFTYSIVFSLWFFVPSKLTKLLFPPCNHCIGSLFYLRLSKQKLPYFLAISDSTNLFLKWI